MKECVLGHLSCRSSVQYALQDSFQKRRRSVQERSMHWLAGVAMQEQCGSKAGAMQE